MKTDALYHLALVTHIIALTLIAGTTLTDYVIFKQFWKQYRADKPKSMVIIEALAKLPVLFGIGFLLIIISGVYMMYFTNGAFGEQIWFRIKFALVILIIINGIVFGRRLGLKLRKNLSVEAMDKNVEDSILKLKRNLSLFHISQLAILIAIFVLSVFKFN
jgi:hypothetical protein